MNLLNRDAAGSKDIWVILGSNSESKPTKVPENSLFFEMDTKTTYYFDGSAWKELGT